MRGGKGWRWARWRFGLLRLFEFCHTVVIFVGEVLMNVMNV